MTSKPKRSHKKRKDNGWLYKKKVCLICEKPLTYIPVGQRWKIHNPQPHFCHEGCYAK